MSYKYSRHKKFGNTLDGDVCTTPCYTNKGIHINASIGLFRQDHPKCESTDFKKCDGKLEYIDIISDSDFSLFEYLKKFYGIKDKETGFKWVYENMDKSKMTIYRVLDAIWSWYAFDDDFVDISTTELYVQIARNIWMPYLYGGLKKHTDKLGVKKDSKKDIIKFISNSILTEANIHDFLIDFIEENKKEAEIGEIKLHQKIMVNHLIEFILKL